jgi:tetratricopeptide (TPR) repeat protein
MALRKEAARRYGSVEQFAADIRRHLEGLPVVARPNTLGYRTAKFVGRHRTGVVAAGIILLVIVAGMVATIRQARITSQQRDRARIEARKAEQVTLFLQEMLTSADPRAAGRKVTVAEVLDRAADRVERELKGQPEIEAAVRSSIGLTYMSLGRYDAAEPQLRKALDLRISTVGPDHADVAASLRNLSLLLFAKGDVASAEPLCREALAEPLLVASDRKLQEILGHSHPRAQESRDRVIRFFEMSGRHDKAISYRQGAASKGLNHPR